MAVSRPVQAFAYSIHDPLAGPQLPDHLTLFGLLGSFFRQHQHPQYLLGLSSLYGALGFRPILGLPT